MKRIRLTITARNFHRLDAVRIQQGETWVGPEVQCAILKSCVCVGFYCGERGVGASSHITDFHSQGGHHVVGALEAMEKGLRRHGLEFSDCDCFVIGGTFAARHVYDVTVAALRQRKIPFEELDVLGDYHRKFVFTPKTGEILLYKKLTKAGSTDAEVAEPTPDSLECFHDPKRRLITGASLFFRNQHLIDFLLRQILPEVFGRSQRLHVWCAGCSNGMEVYSIAMLILDYIERKKLAGIDFRILGTDISTEAIETAREGEYQLIERAEGAHARLFKKYLDRPDVFRVRVGSALRRVASFIQRDIREGSRHHLFDLTICDHVLQYFSADVQSEMLAALLRAMAPAGYAYISSPSRLVRDQIQQDPGFQVLGPDFYRRQG